MKHLTLEQRYEIYGYLRAGFNKTQIASAIGVHKSTVTRELRRNSYLGTRNYFPRHAHEQAAQRRRVSGSRFRRSVPERVYRTARELLCSQQLSPEQIVGHCRRNGIRMCSHETLYKWIWKDKRRGGDLYRHLRHSGRRYRKRGSANNSRASIRDAVDISLRPAEVDGRGRFGDFEADTIVGKTQRQHILTVVERKTRRVWLRRLAEPSAGEAAKRMTEALRPLSRRRLVKTITSDNGNQFAQHRKIAKDLKAKFFFARPYHPWERGTNENTNGLVRQYIPKSSDFDDYSDEDLRTIEDKLNNRPRKILNFATPNEVLKLLTKIDPEVAFRD